MENRKQNGIYYGWWIAIAGFLAMAMVYSTVFTSGGLFLKPVCDELGFSRSEFALTTSLISITMIVLSTAWGKRMAEGKIKLHMAASLVLGALGLVGYSMSTQIWQFYICAIGLGIAFTGATTMPFSILLNNWFGVKKRGTAMSIAFIGSGVGSMIVSPSFTYVITIFGWRTAYLVNAAVLVVIMVIILLVVKKTPEEKGLVRQGDEEMALDENGAKIHRELTGLTLAEAKKASMMWFLVAALVLAVIGSSSIATQAFSYFTDIGFTPAKAALTMSVLSFGLIFAKLLLGYVSDKKGVKPVISICFLLLGISSLVLFFVSNVHSLIVLFIPFYCLGVSAITVCPPLCVSSLFGEKGYGSLIGVATMATGLGGAVGPLLCAKLFDVTGSYRSAWILCACALVIAVILILTSFQQRKKYSY